MKTETEIKFDEIVANFLGKPKERNGYEIFVIPEPLKISILGHSGAGKTTLIETLTKYLSSQFSTDDTLSIFIPLSSQNKYKRVHDNIDSLCRHEEGFETNLNMGRGTSSVQTFDFDIEFRLSEKQKLALHVLIQDTPGGFHHFVNLDSELYDDCSPEYKKFVNHLQQSQIVIIPIDTIKMMCVGDDGELRGAYSNTIQLESIKSNLQQYFARDIEKKYSLHFVLTKCESYFSQDKTGGESEKCFKAFLDWYSEVSNLFYTHNNVSIHYTPVETVGSFRLKKNECSVNEDANGKYLVTDSVFEATGQKKRIINGINDLTDDIFSTIEDIIRFGYISQIRQINYKFMKYDKGFINIFTGRNAKSKKINNLLKLIDIKRPELESALDRLKSKNHFDGYDYHTIIREKF